MGKPAAGGDWSQYGPTAGARPGRRPGPPGQRCGGRPIRRLPEQCPGLRPGRRTGLWRRPPRCPRGGRSAPARPWHRPVGRPRLARPKAPGPRPASSPERSLPRPVRLPHNGARATRAQASSAVFRPPGTPLPAEVRRGQRPQRGRGLQFTIARRLHGTRVRHVADSRQRPTGRPSRTRSLGSVLGRRLPPCLAEARQSVATFDSRTRRILPSWRKADGSTRVSPQVRDPSGLC